jgi:nitrogen fixation protein FixH
MHRKGLAYNQRIAEGMAQEQRGWRGRLVYQPESARLRVQVADHNGTGVPGLAISGEIGRPATDRFDRRLDFTQIGPGTYEAEVAGLEPGWWTVDIEARKSANTGAEVLYETKERLWIKP